MDRRVTSPTWGPPTPCKRALRMDKTNINALIQSIERSVHSIYKNRFSVKQQKFKQIWPEFQSIKCISLKNLSINTFWEVGSHEMVPLSIRGSISCVHLWREWPNLGGLALRHKERPTTDLSGSIFFLARTRKSLKNRHSIHDSSSC